MKKISLIRLYKEAEENSSDKIDKAISLFEDWGFRGVKIAGCDTRFRMAIRVSVRSDNKNASHLAARQEAIYRLSLALDPDRTVFRNVTGLRCIGL